jgi:hypothetical protein
MSEEAVNGRQNPPTAIKPSEIAVEQIAGKKVIVTL